MPTRKWGAETLVNTTLANGQQASSVALLADGSFIVVWQDGEFPLDDTAIRGQRFSATGTKMGGELLLFAPVAGLDQTAPTVTGLSNGNFYLAWNRDFSATDDDVNGHVFTPTGTFVTTQQVGANSATQHERDGDVAAFRTGGSVMVWRDNLNAPNDNISMSIYDAAGNPVGASPILVDTGNENDSVVDPQVSISPTGTILVTHIYIDPFFTTVSAELFTSTGNSLGAMSNVGESGSEADPTSAWLSDGSSVVAWASGTGDADIYACVFASSGFLLTGPFRVNSTDGGHQARPDIAALPGGGFVIAWTDESQTGLDDSGAAIRLQAFTGLGVPVGGEIVVNTTTLLDQHEVSLAALADGRVAVTWTDAGAGGDIHMQIVDPRDGLVTGTGAADTLYGHNSVGDEISGGAGNDIMHGLKGNDQLHGGAGDDAGDGGHGDDALYGGTGNDNLSGRLGDDDLFGESGSDLLNGGAGADLLHGGPGLDTASYAAGGKVNVSLDGSFAATGEAAGDVFVLVEHLQGSNAGSDILRGNAGSNTLSGLGANDVVQGMAGNDIIYGGLGADNLSGGANNDTFLYNALTEIGDIIQDFATIDQFLFRGTAFANLAPGPLVPSAFQASPTNAAANANVRFIFETDETILWFDADGSGGVSGPVMVANLQIGATMTNADIVIF